MKQLDLAIVIPTLNEEHYIGRLLDSIAKQTVKPKEIVVVDAFSKQRNFGANNTSAKHILFLDADGQLKDPDTLKKYMDEVERRKPDIAAALNHPLSDYWKDRVFFKGMNLIFRAIKPFWPMATGMNLYIRRDVFEKVKGFDEMVRVGEDIELVQRVVKKGGRFLFLKYPKIYTSVRRLEEEGRRKFAKKMFKAFFKVIRHGHQKNDVEYEFGKFGKE